MTETEARLEVIKLSKIAFQKNSDWNSLYREAEKILRPFLFSQDCQDETIATLGAVLSDMGRHSEAFQMLKSLIAEKNPNFRQAHFNLGVAMMNLEEHRPDARNHLLHSTDLVSSDSVLEAYFDPHAH